MSFANGRSPFRPLQQSKDPNFIKMQSNGHSSFRSRDSPMDFSYDSPSRQQSSTWLKDHDLASNKRNREDIQMNEPYIFGSSEGESGHKSQTNGNNNIGGTFLFQQPISNTIPGPEVDMQTDITPKRIDSNINANEIEEQENIREAQAGTSKRPVSQSAVLRVNRQRAANNKKSSSNPRRRKVSLSRGIQGQNDVDEDAENHENVEWEDDERHLPSSLRNRRGYGKDRDRSLSKRVGDTLNIHYFFNGSQRNERESPSGNSSTSVQKWLDPEWCLGMAQFGFNATLLIGVIWILFNVIITLQRDVSSKVREYELEYLAEIEACSQSFHLNKCGTEYAVPALTNACQTWQRCSARDPGNVGKARVAAETVAEIVNGFVDVVSWKSMLFTLLSLIIIVGATNSFLSFFRIRSRSNKRQDNNYSISQDDPRSIRSPHGMSAYDQPQSRAWYPSPPNTPQSKRMCR